MASELDNLHDLGNELALLHYALVDFPAYRTLDLSPSDYFSGFHERLAGVIEASYEEYGQSDVQLGRVVTFGRDRKLLSSEEQNYCLEVLMDPPLGVVADAEKLKRHRRERDLHSALKTAAKAVEAGETSRALAIVSEALEGQLERLDATTDVRSTRRLLDDWQTEVTRIQEGGGISLGLTHLKSTLGPLFPGAVLVVGAATGNGKSSLVSEILLAAADDKTPAGLISMEDSAFVTTTRWLAGFSGVSARTLHRGQSVEKVGNAVMQLGEYEGRVFVSECIGGNEQDVMSRMSVMARRGAKLIVVDYIGEVGASVPQQDRRNEIRWLVKRLKAHALRIGVALILVSQLSRPAKDRAEGYEPNKHDLKEAGDVENAAEFIVLMWRSREHDFAPVHVKLAKSKIGGMGARWEMQREIYTEDRNGNRVPGSARLREVARDRAAPYGRDLPLVVDDYEAILSTFPRR